MADDKALVAMAKVFDSYRWLADLAPTDSGLLDELRTALGFVKDIGIGKAVSELATGLESLDWCVAGPSSQDVICEHCGGIVRHDSGVIRKALAAFRDAGGKLEDV